MRPYAEKGVLMSNNNTAKKEKIEGALKLLDEAAKDTKEDISGLVREKYHNLERSIAQIEPKLRRNLRDVSDQATTAIEEGKKVARETATSVDQSVHSSPWSYVGGAALAGVVVGFLLGRK